MLIWTWNNWDSHLLLRIHWYNHFGKMFGRNIWIIYVYYIIQQFHSQTYTQQKCLHIQAKIYIPTLHTYIHRYECKCILNRTFMSISSRMSKWFVLQPVNETEQAIAHLYGQAIAYLYGETWMDLTRISLKENRHKRIYSLQSH